MSKGDSLAFSIVNKFTTPPKAVVYRTNQAEGNIVSLLVTNNSGEDIHLQQGTPIAEPEWTSKYGSAFYFTFGRLFGPQLSKLSLTAEGWTATFHKDPNGFYTNWGITPNKDLVWEAGQTISFSIENAITNQTIGKYNLSLDYHGLENLPDNGIPLQVPLLNPPKPGNKDLKIQAGFVGEGDIYISQNPSIPIFNNLLFFFTNSDPNNPIIPPDKPVDLSNAVFIISFVYFQDKNQQNSYGSLCTPQEASEFSLNVAEFYGNSWSITANNQSEEPSWLLQPQSPEILGTGSKATAEFVFSRMMTTLPQGLTSMYVVYQGIPGYNSGYFTLTPIQKKLPAPSLNFHALPSDLNFGDPISLVWTGIELSRVTLSYTELDDSGKEVRVFLDSLKKEIPITTEATGLTLYPKKSTTYTLEAYDLGNNLLTEVQRTVTIIIPPPPTISFEFDTSKSSGQFVKSPDGQLVCFNPEGDVIVNWSITNALGANLQPGPGPIPHNPENITLIEGSHSFSPNRPGGIFSDTELELTVEGYNEDQERTTFHQSLQIHNVMSNPIGSIIAFSGIKDPAPDKFTGAQWLLCDGRAVSTSGYSELYLAIGHTFGNGSSMNPSGINPAFNLPDFRGRFLRGTDIINGQDAKRDPDAAGRKPMATGGYAGAKVGSVQGHEFAAHSHIIKPNGDRNLSSEDGPIHQVAADPKFTSNPTMRTQSNGGNETRPINAYVNFLIRVK